jgi:hypothetical protein
MVYHMQERTAFSTLLIGLKGGVVATLTTAFFLPLPIIIGDYFGRINTVGHYSGSLPFSWICGLSLATVIPFSVPFVLGGCVMSWILTFSQRMSLPRDKTGRLVGSVIGILAVLCGLILFDQLGLLTALGGWIFIGIMLIWGSILFGWIGHRTQQSIR